MPPRAAPRSMKTASPLGQQGGFGAVTDNLVLVVDPETHPGASRPLSLSATPPREGIFRAGLPMSEQCARRLFHPREVVISPSFSVYRANL